MNNLKYSNCYINELVIITSLKQLVKRTVIVRLIFIKDIRLLYILYCLSIINNMSNKLIVILILSLYQYTSLKQLVKHAIIVCLILVKDMRLLHILYYLLL